MATIAERVACLETEVLTPPSLPFRVRALEQWRAELRGALTMARLTFALVFGNSCLLGLVLFILARNGWR